jgi:superfamily II DNA/RNA helicase
VARQATASETIEQALVSFTPTRRDRSFTEKRAVLRALIRAEGEACTNGIVFCNRKMDVDVVAKSLKSHGFNAAPIHGDLDQSQRTRTLDAFREGELHILVASDVAARGLDIPAVSHVFNFDVPSHPEDYVHRIGRTGRAGRQGKAFTIAVPMDDKYLSAIESLIKKDIPRAGLPEGLNLAEAGSDRPPRDDRPARGGRDRDRDRKGRTRDRAPREADVKTEPMPMQPLKVVAAAEAADEAQPEPRDHDRRPPRDRSDARREDRRDDRREERRDDRRSDDRRDRRDRDSGPSVVGMGDHVPDFILRSFAVKAGPADEAEDAPAAAKG